jgi:recombination protein RecA
MDDNKSKALAAALAQIEKQFGKGSIMRMGEGSVVDRTSRSFPPVRWGSTSPWASAACHAGRVVEIYGPESSGKTTLTLQVIAEMQKLGGTAAFIDAEHALDPGYAQKLGRQTSTSCSSRSRTPANRRWKSPTCWCARRVSM